MKKVLIISGGNNGIGFYMAKQWLEDGNYCCVLDLSCNNINDLRDRYPDSLIGIQCDVSSYAAVNDAIAVAYAKFGRFDFAVHNACLCLFKSFNDHSDLDFNNVMAVNFAGARNIARAILPFMLQQKSGKICFTSSGVGVTGFMDISSYAASKGAIEAFAKCMNIEYADTGVTFHILHPPLTDTKSSSPLPVPIEFKASADKVGRGLAKRMETKKFIITPSIMDGFSVKMSYLFPLFMGRLLARMTKKTKNS